MQTILLGLFHPTIDVHGCAATAAVTQRMLAATASRLAQLASINELKMCTKRIKVRQEMEAMLRLPWFVFYLWEL